MKKRMMVILTIVGIVFSLFFIRLISDRQLDDVSPGISCDKELMEKVDVFYVIPKFEGKNIEGEWCEDILSFGKEVRMHGVEHSYWEFLEDRSERYLDEGMNIFEGCFGFAPDSFKPGQLKISKDNKKLVEEKMDVDLILNQIFHKVYHCEDSGRFPNWVIDLI